MICHPNGQVQRVHSIGRCVQRGHISHKHVISASSGDVLNTQRLFMVIISIDILRTYVWCGVNQMTRNNTPHYVYIEVICTQTSAVDPMNYIHGSCLGAFVVVSFRSILPKFLRIPSLALGQSYDCPNASEVILRMWVKSRCGYQTTTEQHCANDVHVSQGLLYAWGGGLGLYP